MDFYHVHVSTGSHVYLLFQEGVCVYVGMSTSSWLKRVGDHTTNKSFDEAVGIPCDKRKVGWVESELISLLNPRHNSRGRSSYTDGDFGMEEALAAAQATVKRRKPKKKKKKKNDVVDTPEIELRQPPGHWDAKSLVEPKSNLSQVRHPKFQVPPPPRAKKKRNYFGGKA